MAYVKTVWENGATALSAEHMNNIEDGIAYLDENKVDTAFGKVKVGSITLESDSKSDTLELVGSGNVTLTADSSTDTIEISTTANTINVKPINYNVTQTIGPHSCELITVPVNLSSTWDFIGIREFYVRGSKDGSPDGRVYLSIASVRLATASNLEIALFNGYASTIVTSNIYLTIAYKG